MLDQMIADAVDLLPQNGSAVEFNAFKEQLYEVYPAEGKDILTHMIKKQLVKKTLGRDGSGKIIVNLSKPAV